VHRFFATVYAPASSLRESLKQRHDEVSPRAKVFNVDVFGATAATQDDQRVLQVTGLPRKADARPKLCAGDDDGRLLTV
jgi:hypothetical protein